MIDIGKLPTHILDLGQMTQASEIKQYMKQQGIKYYCYAFIYASDVMKYGMSADNDWQRGSYGERVYRQSFHIPGWAKIASPNSAGNDMLDVIQKFPNIDRKDVCIKIWDMTNYAFASSICPKKEVGDLERQLMDEHEKQHKCLPKGNIRDERTMPKKAVVTDAHFESLFG
jgi:hypothetical protein